MKAVVTGGAGFIGSHLVEALLKEGFYVSVVDDFSTGSLENLSPLLKRRDLHLLKGSIQDVELLKEVFKGADIVFHLAASVGVRRLIDDPIGTIRTNVIGTDNVLSIAAKYKCRLLLASSSEVYGKSSGRPFSEEDDIIFGATTKSRWSYGCSKAVDEFLALAYHKRERLDVVIVRFFNIVGRRQTGRYGMVLPRFIHQALNGEPLSVYGDGEQIRTFCYVGDAIEALLLLTRCESASGKVINLGSPHPIRIKDLAETVRRIVNPEAEIEFIPYEAVYGKDFEDILYRVPDLKLLKKLIDYVPQTPIEETIRHIVAPLRSA